MEINLRDERLAGLSRELRPGNGPCPFVIAPSQDATTTLAHFSAGRDATYVVIEAAKPAAVTVGYAPFVEGTTLIYDVTDETLQGKARPFTCDLKPTKVRVYALLPVQMETIHAALRGRRIEVEFRDAGGERLEAALPFQLTLTSPNAQHRASFCSTDRDGRFVRVLESGEDISAIAVRSLLTGREERAALLR
jgi:hypothetical protein